MVDPNAGEAPAVLTPNFLDIIRWPDDRLHLVCAPISAYDEWLEQFALDLFATMKQEGGIGLSAPQVGVPIGVFALWVEEKTPILFVNPQILEVGDASFEWEEGCLSVPGYYEKRKRPQRVVVQYQDVHGKEMETEFQGLYAFAVQHEMDHLDGKVFVDNAGTVKKQLIKRKIKKFLRAR